MATTGMPRRRASFTAFCARIVSITTSASGNWDISRIPSRLRRSFAASRLSAASSCFPIFLYSGDCSICSMYFKRPMLLRIVERLVSVPPSQRRLFYRFLRLFLAAHEQDLASTAGHLPKKLRGAPKLDDGLIQIDDVNLISLFENERFHFRIPALGLMPKMDARFQEFRHYFCG